MLSPLPPAEPPAREEPGESDLDRMQHEVRELRRDRIEHIPRLTPHEVQVLEDAFRKLDVDKSGKVSFNEFSSLLKRDGELCLIMTRGIISDDGQDHLTLKELARLWEVIDQDMSATLTVEEIKAVWQPAEMRGVAATSPVVVTIDGDEWEAVPQARPHVPSLPRDRRAPRPAPTNNPHAHK